MSFIGGFAVGILFESVLDVNLSITEKLTIHTVNGRVGGRKGIVRDKGKAFALARDFVLDQVRRPNQRSKGRKRIVQELLSNILGIQIANKEIGPDIGRLVARLVK